MIFAVPRKSGRLAGVAGSLVLYVTLISDLLFASFCFRLKVFSRTFCLLGMMYVRRAGTEKLESVDVDVM